MTIVRLLGRGALLLMLAVGALSLRGPAQAADQSVQPSAGAPGTTFVFTASGFKAEERVSFWLNPPDGGTPVGDNWYAVDAGADGVATWSWKAPADALGGTWGMVGFGNSSTTTRVIPFTINRAAPTPAPSGGAAVQPAQGEPGTRFAFSARGFTPGETVSYWASSPAGFTYGNAAYLLTADPQGQVAWSWASPSDATRGIWLMVARGTTSGVGAVIRFTIVAEAVPTRPQVVQPAAGPPGTTFTFSVGGFKPDARISYWLDPPKGYPFGDRSFYVSADEQGRATWSWTAPGDAAVGDWIMVAVDPRSDYGEQIHFRITPP